MARDGFDLEKYEKASPDTKRLMELMLARQYRRKREDFWLNMAGLITSLIVALSFLFVSAWLIYNGAEVAGTILGSVDLVALVGVFRYSANARMELPPGSSNKGIAGG